MESAIATLIVVSVIVLSVYLANYTKDSASDTKSQKLNDILTFTLPDNFDINNYSGGGRLGAFAGDKVEKFKIRFTGYAKEWIKNHKWADDQTFVEDEESTTITFSSSQFEKVFESMLCWGRQAEPLAPCTFRKTLERRNPGNGRKSEIKT